MRPARLSARMLLNSTAAPQPMQVAPEGAMVPAVSSAGAAFKSCPVAKLTCPPTTAGTTYASLPFFLPSHHERTSGMAMPQAGLGQVTVRVQIQAITVAWEPSDSVAFG